MYFSPISFVSPVQFLPSLAFEAALQGSPLGVLANLQSAFAGASGAGFCGLPPIAFPSPGMCQPGLGPICGGGYAQVDLAHGASDNTVLGMWTDSRRIEAVKFERALKTDPGLRSAFEASIGGRIVSFGDEDGRLTIERFPTYAPFGLGLGNPLAQAASGIFGALAGIAGPLAMMSNPFGALMLSGLGNVLGGMGGGLGGFSSLGGFGSANPLARPGLIGNNSAMAESQHQAEVSSVLHDPSLTVEDRVMLMLMLICKKMDDDIQKQSEYINKIQQQQGGGGKKGGKKGGGGGKKGGGKKGKGGGDQKAPSIDIETKKLERMVQKRQQMFDMLKGIMEKYDATAKGVIQSLGR